MIDALRAWWRGLRHLNHRGYIYIWANILWFVLSLPLITAPAAWAGLVNMSRKAYMQPTADLHDFWEGFRENLGRGAVMAVANLLFIGINVVNLLAYREQNTPAAVALRGVWLLALIAWAAVQMYLWPLLYELQQPSLLGALRNAAVMALLNPVYTLTLLIGVALVGLVSAVLVAAWPLLTGGLLASVITFAVFDRLAAAGLREPISDPVQEMDEPAAENL
jgi:uncharacterized membrane protein YesL